MSHHLTPGTKITTPYGPATITRRPDSAGVMGIQYDTEDLADLDTTSEAFAVAEPATRK